MNVYAIEDGDDLLLIDGGEALEESRALLSRCLTDIGRALGDIREFLVTHAHRDHYTQAVAIRRLHGSGVRLGEGEQVTMAAIQAGERFPAEDALHRSGAASLIPVVRSRAAVDLRDWEQPDAWMQDGLEIPMSTRCLRVIATPGHTRGHVVFHDPDAGILFGGDHVLPHITPSIGVEAVPPSQPHHPLADFLDSLRVVRALPDATLLPAHGPAGASTHHRVEELLTHHDRRLASTEAALMRGASTAFEAARLLTWTRHERPFGSIDGFNQVLAVQETRAHLDVLVTTGRASVEAAANGVLHYRAVEVSGSSDRRSG